LWRHFQRFLKRLGASSATVDQRIDIHWQLQDDFVTVPGLRLNLIGKVEGFQTDFARVLDHIGVTNEARARYLQQAVNPSSHQAWQEYYTDALAGRVYRAYERDFDNFAMKAEAVPRGERLLEQEAALDQLFASRFPPKSSGQSTITVLL
jgi:Sulfotransferase family